jgi:hypothetical protein
MKQAQRGFNLVSLLVVSELLPNGQQGAYWAVKNPLGWLASIKVTATQAVLFHCETWVQPDGPCRRMSTPFCTSRPAHAALPVEVAL